MSWNANQLALTTYYQHLCPFQLILHWLHPSNHSNTAPLTHREISLSMTRSDGKEIYARYLSVKDEESFKELLLSRKPIPHKFDIGAVYTKPVKNKDDIVSGMIPFYPIAREYVLDIDMNDYDDIRTCCQGKVVCRKCWLYIVGATKLLDQSLRADGGFTEILWVFSGRRGIHCWVTDRKAKRLNSECRIGLSHYLTLLPPTTKSSNFRFKGRYESRAIKILGTYWPKIIEQQDLFFHPERGENIRNKILEQISQLTAIKVEDLEKEMRVNYDCWGNSLEFWKCLTDYLKKHKQVKNGAEHIIYVMLSCMQPRLDINVSKEMNHLLKAPFCIHSGTGKVCCPLLIERMDEFDPNAVPTLSELTSSDCQAAREQFEVMIETFRSFITTQKENRENEK